SKPSSYQLIDASHPWRSTYAPAPVNIHQDVVAAIAKSLSNKTATQQWQENDYRYNYYAAPLVEDMTARFSQEQLLLVFDQAGQALQAYSIDEHSQLREIIQLQDQVLRSGHVIGHIETDGRVQLILAAKHQSDEHRWRINRDGQGHTQLELWTRTGLDILPEPDWWDWQVVHWRASVRHPDILEPYDVVLCYEGHPLPEIAFSLRYLDQNGEAFGEAIQARSDLQGNYHLADPKSLDVILEVTDLNDVYAKVLAQQASIALARGNVSDNENDNGRALYLLLSHSPELIQAMVAVYENEQYPQFNQQQGFVQDVYNSGLLARDALDVLLALVGLNQDLTVVPLADDEQAYHIDANPNYHSVAPHTQIRYQIKSKTSHAVPADSNFRIDTQWYALCDPEQVQSGKITAAVLKGPTTRQWRPEKTGQRGRHRYWGWDDKQLGRHRIVCVVTEQGGARPAAPLLCQYEQWVDRVDLIGKAGLKGIELEDQIHPDDALYAMGRLYAAQQPAIGTNSSVTTYDAYQQRLVQLRKEQDNLEELFANSEGKTRIPIKAYYTSTDPKQPMQIPLLVFITRLSAKQWQLVDWTHPGYFYGHYSYVVSVDNANKQNNEVEKGETIIKGLLADWLDDNRYYQGSIEVEIPVIEGLSRMVYRDRVTTRGRSQRQQIADKLDQVGLGLTLATIGLMIMPIPGSRLLAAKIWGAILFAGAGVASGSAAALRLYDRHDTGINNPKDDLIDVLFVVTSLLEMAVVARGIIKNTQAWKK
ncbi:MAG: hypothetical protein ACC707_03450, partial [Thiohalomonadales bacterium]